MPTKLKIQEGELFAFPTGMYRFREVEEADGTYMFMRVGSNGRLYKTERELEDMLDANEAIRNPDIRKDPDGKSRPVPQDGLAPDEEESEAGMRARTFQFYVKKWDADQAIGRGNPGLAAFIGLWRPVARQKELTWDVQPARLRHAINNCGESGRRPIRAFLSLRGKVKRKRFHSFVENALDLAVQFYFSERMLDYNDAYAYFRSLVVKENERRKAAHEEELKAPARFETLRRRITKAINHVTWTSKYSKREADQKFNGVAESLKVDKPLELVIIDHTRLDAWTVLDHIDFVPFKRPTLTVAIDVATRMILGYLVSGEAPSLYSVLTTLKRVNRNKNYVAQRYPGIDGTWDGWGHPETVLVDRGFEFVSPSFQDSLADLGTEVIWAPIHTPEYKAIGERFFRTLNTKLIHKVEGAVPYDVKVMRLAKLDPKKDAIIRMQDLDRLIHQTIIEGYQNDRHEGIGAIPARIWQEKIGRDRRRFMDNVKALDSILGRVEERTLTKAGIRFKHMVFHDRTKTTTLLNKLVAFEKKRSQPGKPYQSGRVRVKVKWNPADASKIEVWPIRSSERFATTLPNRDKKYSEGISFRHAENVRQQALEMDMKFRTDDQKWNARNRLRELWQKIAGMLPGVALEEAQLAAAQQQPTLENGEIIEVDPDEVKLQADDEGVVIDPPTVERADGGVPPEGRHYGGEATTRKAQKRKKAKKAVKELVAGEKAENRRRNEASGADPRNGGPSKGGASAAKSLLDKLNWKSGKGRS